MPKKLSPREIEELYNTIPRISQEKNDFLLPQVMDFVHRDRWINIRPEYQRRLVWDRKKKSRLIESLLMNVPVPPIFLYEHELSRYEVMDGQQRVNAITEFYNNEFKLSGLTKWSALNGLNYSKCPEKIRRGLDRRRLSATVLLTESSGGSEKQVASIRREVFERLNTGGVILQAQELRNSMFSGPFNDLLLELAGYRLFNEKWGIPPYEDHYDQNTGDISPELANNAYFKRMRDCQLVLRFFAFREKSNIRGSVKKMLDRTMEKYQHADGDRILELGDQFEHCLQIANATFGSKAFKIKKSNKLSLSEPLYDATMVGIERLGDEAELLPGSKIKVRKLLDSHLEDPDNYEVIVGKPNTAKAVKKRLDVVEGIFRESIK